MFARKQTRSTGQLNPCRTNKHKLSLRIDALVIALCLAILLVLTAPRCLAATSNDGNDDLANTGTGLAPNAQATPPPGAGVPIPSASDGATNAETAPALEARSYSPDPVNFLTSSFLENDRKPSRPLLSRKCILFSENLCRAFNDRRIFALAAVQTAALVSDGVTTRQFLTRGYVEVDPLARVFLGSKPTWGRMAPLGAVQVIAGVFLAERMATSRRIWVRRLWWLPQMMGTAGNAAATAHNVALR
jgi:hypothetical protein